MTQTVLITGANRGLGLALVEAHLADGYEVIAACRHPSNADKLQGLVKQNPALRIVRLDVEDQKSIDTLAAELRDQPLDILINNAGILSGSNPSITAESIDQTQVLGGIQGDGLRKILNVNTIAPVMVSQALLPNLKMGKKRVLAMISSGWGSIGDMDPDVPLGYGASKAALNFITKNIALSLQNERFVVVTLAPGWLSTDMGGASATLTAKESAGRLIKIIQALTPEQTGQFIRHTGEIIPW